MKPKKKIHNSLQLKIFFFNLAIVIGMFILFSMILLKLTFNRTVENALETAKAALKQSSILFEEKAAAIRSDIDNAALEADNISRLTLDNKEKYADPLIWNVDYSIIEKSISDALYYSDISKAKIVTDNAIASSPSTLFINLSNVKGSKWYAEAEKSLYSFFWHKASDINPQDTDEEFVCFTRNLPYAYYNSRTYYVGYVKKQVFENLLNANVTDTYTSYYIVNSNDDAILGEERFNSQDFKEINAWIRERQSLSDAPIEVQRVNIGDGSYYIGAARISKTDLTLIYTYSYSRMAKDSIQVNLSNLLLVILVVFPFIMLFSFLVASSITKPIDRLKKQMLCVSEGNLSVSILPAAKDDEVGVLTKHFNYMLTKISMLMDEQYTYGKRIKELELKSLQAQINPHFLYNTLDLIKWKAIKRDDMEIKDLVNALSTYYRRSLGKGEDMVSLRAEVDHITSYVYIQNKRFDDGIHLQVDIEEACYECMLPKLTLQPIIENAITHGILEKEDSIGKILLKARLAGDLLNICIVDDGIGMTQKQADNLISGKRDAAVTRLGYGIRNIDERIKLAFGSDYGLCFISQPHMGTAAILTIPKNTGKETE